MNRSSYRYRVFAGIDLGHYQHQLCALHPSGQFWAERSFSHSYEGLATAVDWLLKLARERPADIAVAVEKPHGAVIETLLERDIAVYAINPKQVDRFRDRYTTSGAKHDRRDAFVLADSLRTDGHRFQRLRLPPPEIIEMRELLRSREQLVKTHVALSSQSRDLLARCWPHLLPLAPRNRALDSFFCNLLERFIDNELDDQTVRELLKTHRIRRLQPQVILDTFQNPPLRVAPGTLEAISAHLRLLLQQILVVRRQRRNLDLYLEKWFLQTQATEPKPSDAAILASLPGVGSFVLASLLCHAHDAIRLRNLDALRCLSGIAPVTKKSGKWQQVSIRRARSQPLNFAVHHWAAIAVQRDERFADHYSALRNRGHSYARALRGVADRMLNTAVAMLRDRTLYEPARRKDSS